MRAFAILCAVGAALYGLLLLADGGSIETNHTIANARPNTAPVRSLGSWGPYLPAALLQRPTSDRPRFTEQKSDNPRVDVSEAEPRDAGIVRVEDEDIDAATPTLAPRVHGEPPIHSATANPKQRSRTAKSAPQRIFVTKPELRTGRRVGHDDRRPLFGLFSRRFATSE
jgi:hypothetical protein